MDVPLALNYIGIRHGLIEHRKFTSFCHSWSECELSALSMNIQDSISRCAFDDN